MTDCLFCKIAAGEIPSDCLYQDEQVFVFRDIDPQAPEHFLVIPREHIQSAASIKPDNSQLIAHVFEGIARLAEDLGLDSFRIVSNAGERAGQSVPHLHFHVLSGRDMTWPPG
jgi:histidine triad (HIT) family protein